MRKGMYPIWCSVALLALTGAWNVARAQVLYGSLTGNVIDPADAAIPGAKVEASNVGTGSVRQAITDPRGAYLFNNLAIGTYRVTVAATGFQTTIVSDVEVNANEVRRVDLKMQIALAVQTVEISASAAVLQTDKSDVHAQISAREVVELPYNGGEGKNFQSLLYLIPGAGIPSSREANSEAGNPQRAQTLFMNGVSSTGNSTKLDGATVAYPWLPVNIAYVPPGEAIETVNITTNSFDAEQGAAGGAAVNVTIKSGTNELHGVAFERHQNNNMTAVNYFSHTQPLNKNIFNQYGFAVGGPVWVPKIMNGKNKLFFFADYQGTKRRVYAASSNLTLPTPAMRAGDFNATGVTIYDPLTGNADGTGRQPFSNNTVPSSRIDPASKILSDLLPSSLTRPNSFTSNYDAYGNTEYNRGNWDFKVNYNPTQKSMVWGRYSISPMDIVALMVLGPAAGDAFGGGNPGHAGGRVQTTAAGFTYTITPTILVDGNVGYTRQNIGANGDPEDGLYGLNVLKIPGTNGVGANYYGIPGFQVTGVANIGNTNTGSPFQFRDNQYTTGINLGKVHGAHNLRFGFQYDKFALNHFQPQGGTFGTARGTFGFDGTLTALRGGAAVNFNGAPANSWAQFLLGFPSRMGKITQFQNPNALRFSDWCLYARDQWQVTRNLTVNYGLRWEYYPIFAHNWYGASRYDPSTYTVLIGGLGGVPWDTGATASKKGFAPRLGLAYRLGPRTVVRTGYGITVDPDNMRNQRNSYPSVINQDYTTNSYQFVSTPGAAQGSLRTGLPAPTYPDITVGKITPSPTPSPTTYLPSTNIAASFPQIMNRGYIQSWNFFLQRELPHGVAAETGYTGTHAVHQMMGVNINGAAPNTGNQGRQLYPYLTTDFNQYTPFGNMTYNGLHGNVKWRFRSSIIGAAYSFSKAINNYNGDNGDGTLFRAYPVSYALNKQRAGFDRTHTFQLFHVYRFPFGKGEKHLNHGLIAEIVGGFQISGTLSRFSGLPFTITTNTSVNAPGQGQTAEQISSTVRILGGHDPNTPYFDGSAFTGNFAVGHLGSTGRNILRGPGFFNMDQNVSRTFSFKDGRVKLQFAGEAFNLTNTPSFSTPNSTWAAPTLNPDGSVRSYGNYSVITGTVSSARQLQVGAYIRF